MFDENYNANSILPIHHPFDDQYYGDHNENNLLNPYNSHLLDDDDLFLQDTILPYHPSPPQLPPEPLPPAATNKELTAGENVGEKKAVRKGGGSKSRKTGKKDRHSKIHTAQGPRDRRMRLSLQIARKFFDLQDMLGFDKASKTIEWLFNKSKSAIKDLTDKRNCTSLISSSPVGNIMQSVMNAEEKSEGKNKNRIMCEKRKEARARARERTQEKLKMQKQGKRKTLSMNKEGSEIMEENPSRSVLKERPLEDQMASVGIIEKFLAGSYLMADFGDDYDDAFSMEFPEIGRINNNNNNNFDYGMLSSSMEIMNSECNYQVQEGPNCAFMGRTFNQGY